jgi:hypothetical protein
MDEQKKGGDLYLIKERGNATTKGEIQELLGSAVVEWKTFAF